MQFWSSKKGNGNLPVKDMHSIGHPAVFSSEKEAAEPKAEGLSKFTKATIGFAMGATAGYLLGTWAINPRHDLVVAIQVTSALAVGSINAARHALISEENNSKDLSAFVKWGAAPALLTTYLTYMTIESIAVGTAFGIVGVVKRRIKEKRCSL
jgi:hypothetical protein